MRRFKPIGYTSNPLAPGGLEVNRRKARVIQRDFAICESDMATALIAEIFRFEGSLHPDEPNDGQSTAEATLATVHYFSWLATAPADRRDLVGQNDAACP